MQEFKDYFYRKFPPLGKIDWIIVFSLLPVVVGILVFLVIMIISEV